MLSHQIKSNNKLPSCTHTHVHIYICLVSVSIKFIEVTARYSTRRLDERNFPCWVEQRIPSPLNSP